MKKSGFNFLSNLLVFTANLTWQPLVPRLLFFH